MRTNSNRCDQAGVALISVLLIVAVLTAVVYQLLGRHSLSVAQSQNTLGFDQALSYALGAETLARQALHQDFTETGPDIDTLAETWARAMPPFEIEEEGFVEIQARDLNRCFNINALRDEDSHEQHLRRLKTLFNNLDIPSSVADAVRDWLDRDEAVQGFGAEDSEYLLLEPAYRTPNSPIAHISELRLVAGMAPEYLQALGEHLCVLPESGLAVNVNTANIPLLAALATNRDLEPGTLQTLAQAVREYDDVNTFLAAFPEFGAAAAVLSVTSAYFEVQVRAQVGDSTAVLTSVLHRHPETGAIRLLSRDLGKDFHSLFKVQTEDA